MIKVAGVIVVLAVVQLLGLVALARAFERPAMSDTHASEVVQRALTAYGAAERDRGADWWWDGYVVDCQTTDGTPFKLVAAPVQYDEETAMPGRSPEFNEHGDAILSELGFDWDAILDLKMRGVVA